VDEIGERILDAAVEAASVHGIGRMSVADVAARVGLSRPTVYKRYPSKDALVAAAVRREAMRVVDETRLAAADLEDPRDALTAAVATVLRLAREHPLLDRVVRTEPERLVPLLTTDDGPILGAIRPVIEVVLASRFPTMDTVTCRRVADMLARLLISYALNAPDDPAEVVARVMAAVLVDGAASLVPGAGCVEAP
jgi:AcrR family transcriptional regulator